MSSMLYIASDLPLAEKPNPHYKTLSVNEALAIGMRNIPDFMLAEGYDRDKPGVLLWSDLEFNINLKTNQLNDGGYADDFAVWPTEKTPDMQTEKKYCAYLEWERCIPSRAKELIQYLKAQLQNTPELELWHTWLHEELNHQIDSRKVPAEELTPEDIVDLDSQEVWKYPLTDYCCIITR